MLVAVEVLCLLDGSPYLPLFYSYCLNLPGWLIGRDSCLRFRRSSASLNDQTASALVPELAFVVGYGRRGKEGTRPCPPRIKLGYGSANHST
jgi:hypothetical protein